MRVRTASSQVPPVSFSMTRPAREKPELQYDQVAPSGWFCATSPSWATYFSRQSSPRPVSVKTSPSMPLVWVSRCRMVTRLVTSGSARRSSGSTSAIGASRSSRPSSTSCMTIVAVHTLEMDPIWNTESVVASTPVSTLSRPCEASTSSSSAPGRNRRMPSWAPGTLWRLARSASRRRQCAASMRGRRGPATSPAYCSTQSTTRWFQSTRCDGGPSRMNRCEPSG